MIGTAHDIRPDHRRRKKHEVRRFYKNAGFRSLAHRNRRRALRQQLKMVAYDYENW